MSQAPDLTVREIQLYERDAQFRMPFRFGVVTLTGAPQAFARVRVRLADGREGWGMAAELMAPKWFDKNPALTNEQNFDQLRLSLETARRLYLAETRPATAFGIFARHHREQVAACAGKGLNALIASYGTALIDRAVLDAVLRLVGQSFQAGMRANVAGIAAPDFAADLKGFDLPGFLASRAPRSSIHARHTVGLVDPLTAADQPPDGRVGDGLPETLEEVAATYGHRYFKLKVGGKVEEDLERLAGIAAVLDRLPTPYFVSLDGNEQYKDVAGVLELWEALSADRRLDRLTASILYVEQPIARAVALEQDVSALARHRPVILDESDADFDAFPRGRALGYAGISSKTCKGIYRSILNAARCAMWNAECGADRHFMSAEDLTTQAGLSVQQDLALVAFLGLEHVERNGHHYVHGMRGAPAHEQQAFLAAHPDLYRRLGDATVLRIENGEIRMASLDAAGFASAAEPDWSAMRALRSPDAVTAA